MQAHPTTFTDEENLTSIDDAYRAAVKGHKVNHTVNAPKSSLGDNYTV